MPACNQALTATTPPPHPTHHIHDLPALRPTDQQGPPPRPWPEFYSNPPLAVFDDSLAAGWSTGGSWSAWVQPQPDARASGMLGGQGLCAKIHSKGALSLQAPRKGAFADRIALEFWVYVGVTGYDGLGAQVPNININLAGPKVGGAVAAGGRGPRSLQPSTELAGSVGLPAGLELQRAGCMVWLKQPARLPGCCAHCRAAAGACASTTSGPTSSSRAAGPTASTTGEV